MKQAAAACEGQSGEVDAAALIREGREELEARTTRRQEDR